MFPIIMMLTTALLFFYLARKMVFTFPQDTKLAIRLTYAYFLLSWLLTPLPIILLINHFNNGYVDTLTWLVYTNLGFNSLLLVWFVAVDVLTLMRKGYQRWIRPLLMARPQGAEEERRDFFSTMMSGLVLVGTGSLTGVGYAHARGGATVVPVDVPLARGNEALKTLKIVQFTDLHIGPTIKRDYVEAMVQQINALEPDIIVATGDLVDGSVSYLEHDVEPLGQLKSRYGTFFITGNHEYYSGVFDWLKKFESLGFVTLINEHKVIEYDGAKVLIGGVTDYRAHQYESSHATSPAQAIAGAAEVDLKILLAHQPKSIDGAAEAGFDMQISGHTHGGQYYPWNFVASLVNPYIQGLHLHQDKTWIYVSPGTGYWGPPIRLGTMPEITLFRLV